jgi:hypothetical protein
MSKNVLKIVGAVAVLVVISSCGCCLFTSMFGNHMATEAAAAEAELIDTARRACVAPRVFRTRTGGRATRASDWECVGPEVVAAEAEAARAAAAAETARVAAIDSARAACAPPSLFRGRAGADTSTADGWECISPEAVAAEEAARAEARARTEAEEAARAEATATAAAEAAEAEEAAREAAAEAAAHHIGDTFAMGDFTYEFTALRTRRSIGGRFINHRPPDGAVFVVVSFRERNDGDHEHRSLGSVVERLTDSEGRVYQPDEDAMFRAAVGGDDIERAGDQLMPGVWYERDVIFTVPADSATEPVEIALDGRGITTGGGVLRGTPRS